MWCLLCRQKIWGKGMTSPSFRTRVAGALRSAVTCVVTRITVGLGIVALILSNRYMHTDHGRGIWEAIGWIGAGLFVTSLPFQIYATVQKYRARQIGARRS
jgi:hypothetical protein